MATFNILCQENKNFKTGGLCHIYNTKKKKRDICRMMNNIYERKFFLKKQEGMYDTKNPHDLN